MLKYCTSRVIYLYPHTVVYKLVDNETTIVTDKTYKTPGGTCMYFFVDYKDCFCRNFTFISFFYDNNGSL